MMIAARPTTYRGIKMRSRLEASVAADLDEDGCGWEYEPRAYANEHGQYLPDFQITTLSDGTPYPQPTFMEVRPTLERAYLAMSQMPIIWDSEPAAFLIIYVPDDGLTFYASGGNSRKWRIGYSGQP